jgi:hypothetical protein
MNRRLHNTFLALAASSAMLAVVLVAGAPAAPAVDPGIAGEHPQLVGTETAPGRDAAAAEAASEAPRAMRSHARSRQSVVMPYFSFARRG